MLKVYCFYLIFLLWLSVNVSTATVSQLLDSDHVDHVILLHLVTRLPQAG